MCCIFLIGWGWASFFDRVDHCNPLHRWSAAQRGWGEGARAWARWRRRAAATAWSCRTLSTTERNTWGRRERGNIRNGEACGGKMVQASAMARSGLNQGLPRDEGRGQVIRAGWIKNSKKPYYHCFCENKIGVYNTIRYYASRIF